MPLSCPELNQFGGKEICGLSDRFRAGISSWNERIRSPYLPLQVWGNNISYHLDASGIESIYVCPGNVMWKNTGLLRGIMLVLPRSRFFTTRLLHGMKFPPEMLRLFADIILFV